MESDFVLHKATEKEPFVIVNKPKGLPSAPLKKGDSSALTLVSNEFPECLEVKGKKAVEGGLVHRIDTETSGLLLIAVTQDFYDFIQRIQDEGRFIKTYSASCTKLLNHDDDSYPPCPIINMETGKEYKISSYFRHYGPSRKSVRPVTDESPLMARKKAGSVLYETSVKIMSVDKDAIQVECKIARGFRHQVRCHLAWLGFPVIGDEIYNPEKSDKEMQFSATGLSFPLTDGSCFEFNFIRKPSAFRRGLPGEPG
ncbi:MAG: RNA pseudouridine synthase [Treponema sp.]|nr:RNA pseudouridine synthase [Treponema sp.]